METIVRFEKVKGIGILLFQCSDFAEDKSFTTRTIIGEKSSDHYSSEKIAFSTFRVKPKASYEAFIETKDHKEANLLSIHYYAGRDTKDIIEAIDPITFIVDDKVPVEYQIPTEKWPGGSAEKAKGRVNDILKYKGLDHVEKPVEDKKWDTDCYTKIELLPECRFNLYKKLVD